MRRLKSIIWLIVALSLIGLCWFSALASKLIASGFIILVTALSIFLGPTIDTLKTNIKNKTYGNS